MSKKQNYVQHTPEEKIKYYHDMLADPSRSDWDHERAARRLKELTSGAIPRCDTVPKSGSTSAKSAKRSRRVTIKGDLWVD